MLCMSYPTSHAIFKFTCCEEYTACVFNSFLFAELKEHEKILPFFPPIRHFSVVEDLHQNNLNSISRFSWLSVNVANKLASVCSQ